jgi:hypothetical protein
MTPVFSGFDFVIKSENNGAMVHLVLTPETLSVRPTSREKVAGLLRDLAVPWESVTSVTVEDDSVKAVRGLRAPGLALPRRVKIGTWRGRGGRAMVVVRAGVPALRVALQGERYDELLISHPDAYDLAPELSRRAAPTLR